MVENSEKLSTVVSQ